MATIQSILNRIGEMGSRIGKNSIGKNDFFGLLTDIVKRQQSTELNMSNLSLRKIYASIAAMEADVAAPVGDDGEKILKGQLVVISAVGADMGKVFRYSGAAWEYVGQIGDLSQKVNQVEGNRLLTPADISMINKKAFYPEWLKSYTYTEALDLRFWIAARAIKDIWFEFPNGKPAWWNTSRFPMLRSISNDRYTDPTRLRINFMAPTDVVYNDSYNIDYLSNYLIGWANEELNNISFSGIIDGFTIIVHAVVNARQLLEDPLPNNILSPEGLALKPYISCRESSIYTTKRTEGNRLLTSSDIDDLDSISKSNIYPEWLKSYTYTEALDLRFWIAARAIKDIWFEFPNGKPAWWNTSRFPMLRSISNDRYTDPTRLRINFMAPTDVVYNDGYTIDYLSNYLIGWANEELNNISFSGIIGGFTIIVHAVVNARQLLEDPLPNNISSSEGLALKPYIRCKELSIYADIPISNNIGEAIPSTGNTSFMSSYFGCVNMQLPIFDYNIILGYGQSNSAGFDSNPSLSTANYKGNLMLGSNIRNLNGTLLNPLISNLADDNVFESPTTGFANGVKKKLDDIALGMFDRKFVATQASIGGMPVEQLSKGNATNYYMRNGIAITNIKAASVALGKTVGCSIIHYNQGEASYRGDFGCTTDYATYKSLTKQLFFDLQTDIKAITGQENNPLIVLVQVFAESYRIASKPMSQAQLDISNEVENVVCACPSYMWYPTNRGNHMNPNHYRWMGEYLAKAYYITAFTGIKFKGLQPINFKKVTDGIIIDFYVPVAPMVFDTTINLAVPDNGFTVYSNSVSVPILSMEIINGSSVKLFIDPSYMFTSLAVAYGKNTQSDAVSGGNLRDSDAYISLTGFAINAEVIADRFPSNLSNYTDGQKYPLQNWCMIFYKELA